MELNFSINETDKNFKLRKTNLNIFKKKGFPNKKKEEWKFTDLEKILNNNFKELNNKNVNVSKPKSIQLGFDHNSIMLSNGRLENYDFKFENLPTKGFFKTEELNLEHYLNFTNELKDNSMQNLNTALFDNGFSFTVEKNYKFKRPIVIFNHFSGDLTNKIINNSEIIQMSKNSSATIIEYLIDESNCVFFKNTFKYKHLEENTSLNYYFINRNTSKSFFYDYSNINLLSNSEYKKYIFSSGLKFNKSEININLKGQRSKGEVYSGLFINNDCHQEIKTAINHLEPNCQSHQNIKNVLTSKSKGIFQGKIYVDKIAQKTNAYQLSKGLLIDDNSDFSAKPELEIYADDVKCSHGSTSGNIDPDTIFYLKTRGISEKEAIKMIIRGFLESVFQDVKDVNIVKILDNHFKMNVSYEN